MFLGLTVVAGLGAGLVITPLGVFESSAVAVENADNSVRVTIFPTSGAAINEGQDLAITVSLVNNSREATAAGQVVITTGSTVLGDAAALNGWLAKSDGEQQPGRWLGVIDAPALPVGASIDLTASLPLTNALYGSAWGPRGLAADLEVGSDSAGSGRGLLVWATAGETRIAHLVTLLPVVSSASASGLLTADELALLTSPQGILTHQLTIAAGRDVTLAVDPRIIASIDALGDAAPASAAAWLSRLLALPNESFTLAYADADVALQAQAGAAALTTAGFSDQSLLPVETTPSASPSPSGSASPSPSGIPVVTEGEWAPSLTGITWPAENTVTSGDMAVLSTNGTQFTLLSSSNVASGANSPAYSSVAGQQTLITNAALSQALRDASSAGSEAQWEESFSLASAYLATTVLNPNTQNVAIAALSRENLGEVSETRLAQTLDRLADLTWVDGGSLGALTSLTSAPETTVLDMPESEDRVKVAQQIMERHSALANFSTVLATPALLTDATTREELALLSLAWRSSEGWPSAVSDYIQQTSSTLNSIHIVPSSEIQMVGGQVNIPVTVENSLTLPATVLVRATPSNARLTVDADATILVQAQSQGKALVPVKARVGNGSVLLSVSLFSPSGVPISSAVFLPVNVRADWESWGLGGLGVLFAALLITGVVRTVRKRRHDSAPDAAANMDADATLND